MESGPHTLSSSQDSDGTWGTIFDFVVTLIRSRSFSFLCCVVTFVRCDFILHAFLPTFVVVFYAYVVTSFPHLRSLFYHWTVCYALPLCRSFICGVAIHTTSYICTFEFISLCTPACVPLLRYLDFHSFTFTFPYFSYPHYPTCVRYALLLFISTPFVVPLPFTHSPLLLHCDVVVVTHTRSLIYVHSTFCWLSPYSVFLEMEQVLTIVDPSDGWVVALLWVDIQVVVVVTLAFDPHHYILFIVILPSHTVPFVPLIWPIHYLCPIVPFAHCCWWRTGILYIYPSFCTSHSFILLCIVVPTDPLCPIITPSVDYWPVESGLVLLFIHITYFTTSFPHTFIILGPLLPSPHFSPRPPLPHSPDLVPLWCLFVHAPWPCPSGEGKYWPCVSHCDGDGDGDDGDRWLSTLLMMVVVVTVFPLLLTPFWYYYLFPPNRPGIWFSGIYCLPITLSQSLLLLLFIIRWPGGGDISTLAAAQPHYLVEIGDGGGRPVTIW